MIRAVKNNKRFEVAFPLVSTSRRTKPGHVVGFALA